MTQEQILSLFLEKIPAAYPEHMLCFFAANAARGHLLPFTKALLRALGEIEAASPGYAEDTLTRMAAIRGTGETQYEYLLEILAEMYVCEGLATQADTVNGSRLFAREPGAKGKKNPELEACVSGNWCAVEVKAPRLIAHGRTRSDKPFQLHVRAPDNFRRLDATLPRDNPVKDFLTSAEEKFTAYETFRPGGLRILMIVWDDFCNEAINALMSPVSGLLTPQSFHRTTDNRPVSYSHIDGVVVIRHQHQIQRSTRCEPLVDGVSDPLRYRHEGFPPKAFIAVPGQRVVPDSVLDALNAIPLPACLGAEYMLGEITMWVRES